MLVLGAVGCTQPSGPVQGSLSPGYDLQEIDGQFLPVELPTGGALLASGLASRVNERPRSDGSATGLVAYVTLIRQPNQTANREVRYLNYSVDGDELRIDLCPPPASCLVPTELIGTVGAGGGELTLTQYVNGQAGSVYRYFPVLAE